MDKKTWRYYNHAMIPTTFPHEEADTDYINSKAFWQDNKHALLARWTSDFDCGYETSWWYVIKDSPFDLSAIKAKRRYVINQGIKNFDVHVIEPMSYVDELYEISVAGFSSRPKKYRPDFTRTDAEELAKSLSGNSSMICYGAFFRETGDLCGFIYVRESDYHIELKVQRVNPKYEKYQINAALVYALLTDRQTKLESGSFYILDGARTIYHETKFQDYLEKYFGFRKAYCKLHIVYNSKIKWIIYALYPFRKILNKFNQIGLVHQLNPILKMEEICRSEKI